MGTCTYYESEEQTASNGDEIFKENYEVPRMY